MGRNYVKARCTEPQLTVHLTKEDARNIASSLFFFENETC